MVCTVQNVEDKERSGRPKKFEEEELEALLDEDPCQTQEELAKSLRVTQSTISMRLKDGKSHSCRWPIL